MSSRQFYYSEDFVISAGCVLFSQDLETVCLLRYAKRDEYLLPKGRKDQGEALSATAVRETFEETGYPCELFPVKMKTRAPGPGNDIHNTEFRIIDNGTEPIAMQIRPTGNPPVATKAIFWFIARATGEDRVIGSQMEYETFDPEWFPVQEGCWEAFV
ncbi:hypothetical protein DL96DRAFT_1454376 [Flagelloscypha sp. PMI_526]|nr:hypothetical protein DL96DRAFT_1454376 [Flagelloscypha sp. PMI_526]